MSKIITQNGDPVDDKPTEEEPENFESVTEGLEAVAEAARDISKGVRNWKNSIVLKVCVAAVACKALDVMGKIIIENQRAKREANDED
uniref:Uncharacterized protein n=1 Tax=Streptomyces phage Scarif TaxID=3158858 RepID=A0AAU7GYX9_9CAUD